MFAGRFFAFRSAEAFFWIWFLPGLVKFRASALLSVSVYSITCDALADRVCEEISAPPAAESVDFFFLVDRNTESCENACCVSSGAFRGPKLSVSVRMHAPLGDGTWVARGFHGEPPRRDCFCPVLIIGRHVISRLSVRLSLSVCWDCCFAWTLWTRTRVSHWLVGEASQSYATPLRPGEKTHFLALQIGMGPTVAGDGKVFHPYSCHSQKPLRVTYYSRHWETAGGMIRREFSYVDFHPPDSEVVNIWYMEEWKGWIERSGENRTFSITFLCKNVQQ